MLDQAQPVQGTTDAPTPTFYSAAQAAGATDRINGYNFNGIYRVPGSGKHETPAQRAVEWTITSMIADATPAWIGPLHLSDVRALEAAVASLAARRGGDEREALEQVRAILQATYANAGDNDEAGSLANTEHLLLDLELLHARWAA